jgi:uncharacterized protein YukE
MALPKTWDSATIHVDPWVLHNAQSTLLTEINGILDDLNAIMNTLNGLKISWTGEASTLMDSYNKKWNAATTALYGAKDKPETGILNILSAGLDKAALNYSQGERAISNMFAKYEAAMEGISLDVFDTVVAVANQAVGGKIFTSGDFDLETILSKATPPPEQKGDPTVAPPENTVKDVASGDDSTGAAQYHTTSVNETF